MTETHTGADLRHARVTPLASIFGSGFLVIVPFLNAAVGPYSVVAMAGVCALAYAMDSVIRFNIRHAEPLLAAGTTSDRVARHERISNLALVLAYAISVCLYIHILAAFLLGGLGINTPARENIVTVIIVAAIGAVGRVRGLDMLLFMELWALRVTDVLVLALIEGWQKRAHFSQEVKWVGEMIQEDARRCLELDEKIKGLEAKIAEVAKDSKIAKILQSIPGFGAVCTSELAGENHRAVCLRGKFLSVSRHVHIGQQLGKIPGH
jgi:hypothetical protein